MGAREGREKKEGGGSRPGRASDRHCLCMYVQQPAMDVFSLGCVIGEILLEGTALFDLSQLLRYRAGAYDPLEVLSARVDSHDHDLVELVGHMIKLDPGREGGRSIDRSFVCLFVHSLPPCLSRSGPGYQPILACT